MATKSIRVTDDDALKEIERQGTSLSELAKEEIAFSCLKEWLEAVLELLKEDNISGSLEIIKAILEYSNGNYEYEPKDFYLRLLSTNMRRVIKASNDGHIIKRVKNQLVAKLSRKRAEEISQEYDPESKNNEIDSELLPQKGKEKQREKKTPKLKI